MSRFDVPSLEDPTIVEISKEIMSCRLAFMASEREETSLFLWMRLNEQAETASSTVLIEEDDAAMPDITEFSKDGRADVAHQIFHLQKRKNFDVKAKTCEFWPEMCEIAMDLFE
jgi:hypothetical protein